MDKKKRTRELLVFAAIVIALLILAILAPSGEEGGSIQEVMRDVLHELNKVSLFGLTEVNPGLISAYIVTGILIVFGLICRFFVIPRFQYVPGKFQLLLEQLVGLFDGLAEGSSPHRNKFLRGYIFSAGVYIFVGTLFELLGIQTVTTGGASVSLPAPLSDINGAIAMGLMSYGVILFGGLIVLVVRIKYIPETFAMIFRYAFEPQAIIGGGFGYAIKTAISQGAKRGLFSNEAGMGSTPHAHALANVKCPHDQGVVAMIGVFIDTFVVLTLNALVIISTLYTEGGPLHDCGAAAASTTLGKTNLAQTAFGVVFGESAGNMFVAVCLFFFAFSTILGWNLFGKINVAYLFGKKSTVVYTVLALVFIFLGTMMSNDLVWELSDMFNNLMVIPNAVALFALTSLVVKHADDPNRIPGKK